jgi:APA family basic amino acid/polyamine antiporter
MLFATLLDVKQVVASASIMFLLLFLLVNVCVIKIRRNMGDELEYGFLMPLFPLFPIVAIIAQITFTFFLHKVGITAQIIAITWIAAGILIYHFYSRHHAAPTSDEIYVFEEQKAVDGDESRVMVAVANVDNALSLVRTTNSICGAMDARVELIHMVPVPDQVPLADASSYMDEGKEAFAELMLYLAPLFPISSTLRYCRNVARGIVTALRERKANLLIMGWHGRRRTRHGFTLGSTVDPIIELAPCDVLILKDCGDKKFKKILVPVAGGPNGLLSLRTAGVLAEKYDGEVVALSVTPLGQPTKFDLAAFLESHEEDLSMDRITPKVMSSASAIDAILKEAEDEACGYDLVLLGCSKQPFFRRTTQQSLPDQVAERCSKPLIMASASTGIRSIVNLWL